MKFSIIFVTCDQRVIDAVTQYRTALIPKNFRDNNYRAIGGNEPVISVFKVNSKSVIDDFYRHIESIDISRFDGVSILTDGTLPNLSEELSSIFAIGKFPIPDYNSNIHNLLTAVISRFIKIFKHIYNKFQNGKYHTPLRLPIKNFIAEEMAEFCNLCQNLNQKKGMAKEIDLYLSTILGRQSPKKASSYPNIYFIDNDSKHFSLGKEIHAQADTKCPPHRITCVLGNQFRFGCWFDGRKHFNVSMDGSEKITGDYPDCHGNMRSGNKKTHLNMFTNDFF